jgi:hypothetical protein
VPGAPDKTAPMRAGTSRLDRMPEEICRVGLFVVRTAGHPCQQGVVRRRLRRSPSPTSDFSSG